MKRITLALLCCVLAGVSTLEAQTIRMTRVDALPEKSHFITATLPFSVEIALTGISNVTAVSFELRYNNAGSVQLAGYSGGSFGSSGLLVVDKSNRVSGAGSINVGVLSGQPAGGGGVNDPIVIRLDFITTPDAQHNTNTVFSFINAEAVANGSIVKLAGIPVSYNVHGYVDVWPGDADNNGIVDTRDISIIGLFFDDGGSSGRIRGFSRKPASTAWGPQTALSWDSVRVTYADADGSGKVDINDLLVVYANFSKTHTKFYQGTDNLVLPRPGNTEQTLLASNSLLIPITVNSKQSVLGVAVTVSWREYAGKFKVTGIQRGEMFTGAEGFFSTINEETSTAQFAVGRFNPAPETAIEGPLAYLVVEPLTDEQTMTPVIEQAQGIQRGGNIFPLVATTSVEENEHGIVAAQVSVYPNPASSTVTASFQLAQSGSVAISVVDVRGTVVSHVPTAFHNAGTVSIPVDMSALSSGLYYLVLESIGGKTTVPVTVAR
jgi:hypothetical protein